MSNNTKPQIESHSENRSISGDDKSAIRNPQSAIRNFVIHHYKTLGSTNDQLKGMTAAVEFTCVVADEQTSGRGRRTRRWLSTPGDGLYLSVLLCPRSSSSKITHFGLMAAVAVAEVLNQRGVEGVDIKWPNDVLIDERKVCGILVEGTISGANASRFILGIGVNLNHRSFPPELTQSATSLFIETGNRIVVAEFRDQLLERIAYWYERWNSGEDQLIVKRWQELSSYSRDKKVMIILDDEQVVGETVGLTETGALRVMTESGEMKTILAGEVISVRSALSS